MRVPKGIKPPRPLEADLRRAGLLDPEGRFKKDTPVEEVLRACPKARIFIERRPDLWGLAPVPAEERKEEKEEVRKQKPLTLQELFRGKYPERVIEVQLKYSCPDVGDDGDGEIWGVCSPMWEESIEEVVGRRVRCYLQTEILLTEDFDSEGDEPPEPLEERARRLYERGAFLAISK